MVYIAIVFMLLVHQTNWNDILTINLHHKSTIFFKFWVHAAKSTKSYCFINVHGSSGYSALSCGIHGFKWLAVYTRKVISRWSVAVCGIPPLNFSSTSVSTWTPFPHQSPKVLLFCLSVGANMDWLSHSLYTQRLKSSRRHVQTSSLAFPQCKPCRDNFT